MNKYEILNDKEKAREGLVNALVDHELKALTLIAMEEKGWYSPWELQGRISTMAGAPRDQLVGHNSFGSYCKNSFAPIGLAVRNLDGSDRVEFEITEFGLREGRALAGHMLDFAAKLPDGLSLQKIFGMTHSKNEDIRAPINRTRILEAVYKSSADGVALKEIAEQLDETYDTTVARLNSMVESGVIKEAIRTPRGGRYVALETRKLSGYQTSNRSTRASLMVQALIEDIAEISPKSPFWTDEVYSYLVDNLGFTDDRNTRKAVRNRLTVLVGRGALELLEMDETKNRVYFPVEEMRPYIEHAVSVVNGALSSNKDFIDSGLIKARDVQEDPTLVRKLIRQAIANSPQAQSDWAQSRMKKSHL